MNIITCASIILMVLQRNTMTRITLAVLLGALLDTLSLFPFGTHILTLLILIAVMSGMATILFSKKYWSITAITAAITIGIFFILPPYIEYGLRYFYA